MDAAALIAAVDRLSGAAARRASLEVILEELCLSAHETLDLDGVGVGVVRDQRVELVSTHGSAAVASIERMQAELQEGPCVATLSNGEVIVEALAVGAELPWPSYIASAHDLGLRSVAALPLTSDGRTWAVLDLYRSTPGRWGEEDLAVARTLSNLCVSYLVMAAERDAADEVRDDLAHRALHDDLTGLPTRALLRDRLDHALLSAERTGHPVAAYFVDLDHFKAVNDGFGHAAGDAVLVRVAERIAAVLRVGDSLSRLAGDEFIVVCENLGSVPSADLEHEVGTVLNRLQDTFADPVTHDGAAIGISASIGVALSRPGVSAERLLAEADEAMYDEKQHRHAVRPGRPGQRHGEAIDDLAGAVDRRVLRLGAQVRPSRERAGLGAVDLGKSAAMAPALDTRTLSIGLAGIRLGMGGVLTVAPQFGTRLWIGPDTGGPGTRALARAVGARDVVLGYQTLRAVQKGEPVAGWLQIGAMADAADVVAGVIAMRGLPGHRRFTMPLIAGAVGLACYWAARQSDGDAQQAAEDSAPDADTSAASSGSNGSGATPADEDVLDLDELAADALPEDRPGPSNAEQDDLDDEAAAALLDVVVDRIDVLVADGLLVPSGSGGRRFRRADVLAVRIAGG